MLKNILNLNGAQKLSKGEQKSIFGGGSCSNPDPQSTCENNCSADCYEVFCGPTGPFGLQVVHWECPDITNHK